MLASKIAPMALVAPDAQSLSSLIATVQAQLGGKISILTIYYDSGSQQHVAWYYPLSYSGAGIF